MKRGRRKEWKKEGREENGLEKRRKRGRKGNKEEGKKRGRRTSTSLTASTFRLDEADTSTLRKPRLAQGSLFCPLVSGVIHKVKTL